MEFKNIREASEKASKDLLGGELAQLDKTENVLNTWYYCKQLNKNQKTLTVSEQKAIIKSHYEKHITKEREKSDIHITNIEAAPDFLSCKISVDWTKSKTWGANPKAEIDVHTSDGWEHYESGRVGGCGYDKESTAISNALNQSDSILKALYSRYEEALEKDKSATLRGVLGYGSGYGCEPYFEGGCGVECYYDIFKSIGFTFESVSSDKMSASYSVTKAAK